VLSALQPGRYVDKRDVRPNAAYLLKIFHFWGNTAFQFKGKYFISFGPKRKIFRDAAIDCLNSSFKQSHLIISEHMHNKI